MNKILNIPESVYDYEFMVAEKREDGDYNWIANFCYYNADMEALLRSNPNYITCHNVRIAGKQLKKWLTKSVSSDIINS